MNEAEEQIYLRGQRAVYLQLLSECCRQLGYNTPEVQAAEWIREREAAVSMLRQVCDDYGDNEWEENLHLADVIEKHLWRHLEEAK